MLGISNELLNAFKWIAGAGLVWFLINRIRRPLDPPYAALEFASGQQQAKRVLSDWKDARRRRRVLVTIALEFFLIPLYVIGAWQLALATPDAEHDAITWASLIVAFFVSLAGLIHYAESVCVAFSIVAGSRALVVFVTRILGWTKYTILALAAVYAIFRAEAYLYVKLRQQGWDNTLAALVTATLLVAFFVARSCTRLSKSYPPLVALQLAPSRLAAKDVLERWGDRGRSLATRAVLLQSLLAVLYGLTLAEVFERVDVLEPNLKKFAGYLSWLMLIAAASHIAQNLGAFVAVQRRTMGWWVGLMRKLGWMRMALLGLAAAYSVILLLSHEFVLVYEVGETIAELRGADPPP